MTTSKELELVEDYFNPDDEFNSDLFDDSDLSHSYELMTRGKVDQGMEFLFKSLRERRLNSDDAEWARYKKLCLLHPICELIHQDPFTLRTFEKPRQYAGDAVMMDMIYGKNEKCEPPAGTSEVGRQIFQFTTATDACQGVRARRRLVAEKIDRRASEVRNARVLSIAAGHLREAEISGAVKQRKVDVVALDADPESMAEVRLCYSHYNVSTIVRSIRQLLSGKSDLGEFDLIYSVGLFDYLQQRIGQRLVKRLFEMLRPGGELVIANFLPEIFSLGYMESFMDWELIYRSHSEMLDLAMTIDQHQVKTIKFQAEDAQNVVFLEMRRK